MTHSPLAIHGDAMVRDRGRFVFGPLDLQVPYGEVLAVVGPNGSGKTTLFKLLLGAAHLDSGELRVAGQEPGEAGHLVAAVLDAEYLIPDWTIADAEAAVAPFYPSWDRSVFEHLVAQLDVPAGAKIKELSRGEHSKLKLALALAPGPSVLLLDEPTSGLDPLAREQVLLVMRQFMAAGDRSVVFSTHISQDLDVVSDQIVVLRDGQCVHKGVMAQLSKDFVGVSGPAGVMAEIGSTVIGMRAVGAGSMIGGGTGDQVAGVVTVAEFARLSSLRLKGVHCEEPAVDDVIKAFAVEPPHEFEQVLL